MCACGSHVSLEANTLNLQSAHKRARTLAQHPYFYLLEVQSAHTRAHTQAQHPYFCLLEVMPPLSFTAHSSIWNTRTRTQTHTHTHPHAPQRLVGPVAAVLVTTAPYMISPGVGPNAGAVRGRNGYMLRNILSFSGSFRFTPEIKGWREGRG